MEKTSIFVGLDYHQASLQVCVMNRGGGVLANRSCANMDNGVAFTLVGHPWMHRIDYLVEKVDPVTADFTFARWLGDR